MEIHLKVIIWQKIEVDEQQAKGLMDGSLSPCELDGNIEHLFETEHQLTPAQNAKLMEVLGEAGYSQTIEVWDGGSKVWDNSKS